MFVKWITSLLCIALLVGTLSTVGTSSVQAATDEAENLLINGDFSSFDISSWCAACWSGSKISVVSGNGPTDEIKNYAACSNRTSPYQCFAQDITDSVEKNVTYSFSFWAMLSDDYADAPAGQREVQFAPYTIDTDGNADYNPQLSGTYIQTLEPGVWTYFEGTYTVTCSGDISQVVIRLLEQGTNYGQGDCVMGTYYVADVKLSVYGSTSKEIEEDVPDLRDAVTEVMGDDFIVSTAVTVSELTDEGVTALIEKHFNAVTLGNELKPDALFGYSNSTHTTLKTITYNGVEMEVPTLDFSRAEAVLDQILAWNEENPDNQIKVRGHVLVWHSQTPEWFFREGYVVDTNEDGTPNYVSAEEMNLRLEWYIQTVLEHFTAEDSKYYGLFYAWDVVNEAVSDSGGYRTDSVTSSESANDSTHGSNSSWWAVYGSNEYIINAFVYANKYAPADVDLYYNDYNECDTKKRVSIVKLLTDVKEAEGTRIDGMGMQGHYSTASPTLKNFESAIRAYAEVVDKIMITEWDIKTTTSINTDEKLQAEYLKQAAIYRDYYEILIALKDEGINIAGIVWWGTIDAYSWLQSATNIGGGLATDSDQCPLLFDTCYQVKPAYWAFVDYSTIDPDYVAPTLSYTKYFADDDADDTEEVTEEVVEEVVEEETTEAIEEETVEEVQEEAVSEEVAESAQEAETSSNYLLPIIGGVVAVGLLATAVCLKKKGKKK